MKRLKPDKIDTTGASTGSPILLYDDVDDEFKPGALPVSGITVQDENVTVATGVTQIDFQGGEVTAVAGTGEVIVTIPTVVVPPQFFPLTTEIAGVPDFVWDDDNQLVMTEVTL